jgi:hypothetical protein
MGPLQRCVSPTAPCWRLPLALARQEDLAQLDRVFGQHRRVDRPGLLGSSPLTELPLAASRISMIEGGYRWRYDPRELWKAGSAEHQPSEIGRVSAPEPFVRDMQETRSRRSASSSIPHPRGVALLVQVPFSGSGGT